MITQESAKKTALIIVGVAMGVSAVLAIIFWIMNENTINNKYKNLAVGFACATAVFLLTEIVVACIRKA